MSNTITITKKQNHFINLICDACDNREARGLEKFNIYDMGNFYIKSFNTIQREVKSFCCSDDTAFLKAIYYRNKKGLYKIN